MSLGKRLTGIGVLCFGCTPDYSLVPCEEDLDIEILSPVPDAELVEGMPLKLDASIALNCDPATMDAADRVVSSDVDGLLEGESTYAAGFFSFSGPALSTDDHTLTFQMAALGANGRATVDITVVDNASPSIAFTLPAADATLKSVPIEVAAVVADPQEPLDSLSLSWSLNGEPLPDGSTSADANGDASFSLDIDPGCHQLSETVTDMMGQQGTDSVSFLVVDEGMDLSEYQWLKDGDGWGNPSLVVLSCEQPDGTVPMTEQTDCNDADDTVHPGAADYCQDGIDSDCSNLTPGDCHPNGDVSTAESRAYTDEAIAVGGGYDFNNDSYDDLLLGQVDAVYL